MANKTKQNLKQIKHSRLSWENSSALISIVEYTNIDSAGFIKFIFVRTAIKS